MILLAGFLASLLLDLILSGSAEKFPWFSRGRDISGSWLQSTKGVGESIWRISKNPDGTYAAVELWLGKAAGTANLEGNQLIVRGVTPDGGYSVVYSWNLDPRLNHGTGKLTFLRMPQPNYRQTEYLSTVTRIPPPVWQRRWFISLMAIAAIGAIYAIYRYRVGRLLELERVRTRLASDLHDDIGSNLSLIAGLSEVMQQQAGSSDPQMTERLFVISEVARRSMEAMSDIVWAVNPKRASLLDLVHRMRRFASDNFAAREIKFDFEVSDAQKNPSLGAETRREIFLAFKEAVNNTVRHSGCSKAEVRMQIEHRNLILRLSDNGRGFDETSSKLGQGLPSMRRRAEKLGGELFVTSHVGAGTTVTLKVPLGRSGQQAAVKVHREAI